MWIYYQKFCYRQNGRLYSCGYVWIGKFYYNYNNVDTYVEFQEDGIFEINLVVEHESGMKILNIFNVNEIKEIWY